MSFVDHSTQNEQNDYTRSNDQFFMLSMELLCVVGIDGWFKRVNPALEKALGYTSEELLSQPLFDFLHPDDRVSTSDGLGSLAAGETLFHFENRYRRKDGVYRWMSWTASTAIEGLVYALGRDVTQQKEETASALAYFRDLLEQAPAGIAVVREPDHVFTLANPLYQKLFGRTEKELLGRTVREVFSEIEGQGVYELLDDVFASGVAFIGNEYPLTVDRSDESISQSGYYNFVAQPIKNQQGAVTDILIHVYEVTEQVLARQRVEESEQRFRAIFNQTTAGVAQTDLTGQFVLVNDRFCEIVGYREAELLHKRMQDITHPDDLPRNLELFERMVQSGQNFNIEKRYVRSDGAFVWVNNNVSLLRHGRGDAQYALAVTIDITEQKLAEQIVVQQEHERGISEERQRLARDLHDAVSQALFSASIMADALPQLWTVKPEKAMVQLGIMNTVIRGALAEMRTLLLELRPENIARTDLAALLMQLAHAVQARRPIEISLFNSRDGGFQLPPDVQMVFYRIAQESINNSIKHSGATKIKVGLRRTSRYVMLVIVDNGQGFNTDTNASGFGLTIMQERADDIGASFKVKSKSGKSTRMQLLWCLPTH